MTIDFASATPLEEPAYFFVRHARRPDERAGVAREPMTHPLGVAEITSLAVASPAREPLSPAANSLARHGVASFSRSPVHCLEIGLDGTQRNEQLDLRPRLPLVLRR
jgi:hypothetical protein